MRAKLQDLGSDKYYGTQLKVWDDNGNSVGSIELNLRGNDTTPSVREHDTMLKVFQDEFGRLPTDEDVDWDLYYHSDSHYETQVTYEVALQIERALNGNGSN